MSQARILKYAGIVFLVSALVFVASDNSAIGGSFVAIGAALIAISASQSRSQEVRERREKGGK